MNGILCHFVGHISVSVEGLLFVICKILVQLLTHPTIFYPITCFSNRSKLFSDMIDGRIDVLLVVLNVCFPPTIFSQDIQSNHDVVRSFTNTEVNSS